MRRRLRGATTAQLERAAVHLFDVERMRLSDFAGDAGDATDEEREGA